MKTLVEYDPWHPDMLTSATRRSGFEMVRYADADDFVILCRTADEASRVLELVRTWVSENGLREVQWKESNH